jgi:3-hydroxyisobutyrate dehydrogenase-like beta-hydroxyacid dehydrogenase
MGLLLAHASELAVPMAASAGAAQLYSAAAAADGTADYSVVIRLLGSMARVPAGP